MKWAVRAGDPGSPAAGSAIRDPGPPQTPALSEHARHRQSTGRPLSPVLGNGIHTRKVTQACRPDRLAPLGLGLKGHALRVTRSGFRFERTASLRPCATKLSDSSRGRRVSREWPRPAHAPPGLPLAEIQPALAGGSGGPASNPGRAATVCARPGVRCTSAPRLANVD